MHDRYSLPTPDQLSAAAAKMTPAPSSQLRGFSIQGPIPTFHGLRTEAVADNGTILENIRLGQRSDRAALHIFVNRQIDPQAGKISSKLVRGFKLGNPLVGGHASTTSVNESRHPR